MSAARQFDPLDFPLRGVQVVEASAGTGKTHALLDLYLRAVWELELAPQQILVVTFTDAATADLRQKLAERLRETHARLITDPPPASEDALDRLIAGVAARVPRALLRERTTLALAALDLAAIHTIHGFCHRILGEQAFSAGTSMLRRESGALTPLWREAAADHWRAQSVNVGPAEWAAFESAFSSPYVLAAQAQHLDALSPDQLLPVDPDRELDASVAPAQAAIDATREVASSANELDAAFSQLGEQRGFSQNADSGYTAPRLAAMRRALEATLAGDPSVDVKWLAPLTTAQLAAASANKTVKVKQMPTHR